MGDWKLVSAGRDGPWELYDLRTDRSESNDLAAEQPETAKEMAKHWTALTDQFRQTATALSSAPGR